MKIQALIIIIVALKCANNSNRVLVGIRVIEMFCNAYMEASESYILSGYRNSMHFNMMHFIHKKVSFQKKRLFTSVNKQSE